MAPVVALLASPLLGPTVWQPVARGLRERGWSALPSAAPARAPRTADDVMRIFLAGLPTDRELILVPHSNAGMYVPALTAARDVAGSVFVDARVPSASGSARLGPDSFREFLGPKVDRDGLLPPWTRWWDGAGVAGLFPDEETRERVEREQQRVPLSYFDETVDVPPGWADVPCAYLAFGETYHADREQAHRLGWPVTTVAGAEHLHMLIQPDRVAEEIDSLLATMGLRPDAA